MDASHDSYVLFRGLILGVLIFVGLISLNFVAVSRVPESGCRFLPGGIDGIVTGVSVVFAFVFLIVSGMIQRYEANSATIVPVSMRDGIELDALPRHPRTRRLGRLAKLLRYKSRQQASGSAPSWEKGEPDFSGLKNLQSISNVHVVKFPRIVSFTQALPNPLDRMLQDRTGLDACRLLDVWHKSVNDPDYEVGIAEIGGIGLATNDFSQVGVEKIEFAVFQSWFVL